MKKYILFVIAIISFTMIFSACASNGDKADGNRYTVAAPDGAPAMAIAYMMKNNVGFGDAKASYVILGNNDNVMDKFTTEAADFIIAPTNVGIKAAKTTEKYKLAAVTSWGNLYLLGTSVTPLDECASAIEFLQQFEGKTIASIGAKAVPTLTLQRLLDLVGVNATIDNMDAATIQAKMANGEVTVAVLGEPAVTATLTKVSTAARLANVSELWSEVVGQDFPQAGLFVKNSVIENDKASVDAFLNELSNSIAYLNASKENAKELGDYMEENESSLKGAMVAKCYLQMQQKFVTALNAKDAVLPFVQALGVSVTADELDSLVYQG